MVAVSVLLGALALWLLLLAYTASRQYGAVMRMVRGMQRTAREAAPDRFASVWIAGPADR